MKTKFDGSANSDEFGGIEQKRTGEDISKINFEAENASERN